jgi:hypothetical protein
MTVQEAGMVLAVLRAAYPSSYRDLTEADAYATAKLWAEMFSDDSYAAVNAAVRAMIATRTVGYAPTIGEVKEKLYKITEGDKLSETEAWAMVAKACCNGYYGYQQEYNKLPPEVQKTVGKPEQLREWAQVDTDTLNTVIASNFQRSFRVIQAREKENAMLPPNIRQIVGKVADSMKMIGAGNE